MSLPKVHIFLVSNDIRQLKIWDDAVSDWLFELELEGVATRQVATIQVATTQVATSQAARGSEAVPFHGISGDAQMHCSLHCQKYNGSRC